MFVNNSIYNNCFYIVFKHKYIIINSLCNRKLYTLIITIHQLFTQFQGRCNNRRDLYFSCCIQTLIEPNST